MPRWLGLDLGGTNIKSVILDGDVVVDRATTPTEAAGGPAAVVDRLIAAGRSAIERCGQVDGVGVGVPGLFDADTGKVVFLPNLPGPWKSQPLATPLADALGAPAAIINDARAFTLAEARLGAATGASTVICLVLGTGIGGGVVIDGHLHLGRHGRAGEIAHQTIVPDGPPCTCGNRGCLEALASSGALARLAGRPDAAAVFAAAADGDERASTAIETAADHFGVAIANLITVLVPERVVIGGGVAAAGELLLAPIRAAVARHSVLVPSDWYEVVPAALGPDAGAIGAALWASDVSPPARGRRPPTGGRGGRR